MALGGRPWPLTIPEPKDVFVGELAESGYWVVASIDTWNPWPVIAQCVTYRGKTIWIIPLMADHYPGLAIKLNQGLDQEASEKLLMQFLSTAGWVERRGYLVESIGLASRPTPLGRQARFGVSICEELHLTYLPEPDDRAMLALALLREGRGLNHPGYAFLSFFRVLEVALPQSDARTAWMTDALGRLKESRAKMAIEALQQSGVADLGSHLYVARRSAMAHAGRGQIINPDDPKQMREVRTDLPIIEELATLAIEEVLGVESAFTYYDKHLYELSGFKSIIGNDLLAVLDKETEMTEGAMLEVPEIDVTIRKRVPYPALQKLTIAEIERRGRNLYLAFRSISGRVRFSIELDFRAERLRFDLVDGVVGKDDGSPEAAEEIADIRRFYAEYFLNGELQIHNADTGELIARKDAFIPRNMIFDADAAQAGIDKWLQLAEERRDPTRRYRIEMARLTRPYQTSVKVTFDFPG
jgi:hypothetical protein